MPSFDPKTYPDVVKNLTWWAGVLLVLLVYVAPLALPLEVRAQVGDWVSGFPSGGIIEPALAIAVLAVVLVYFFKVHDLYDSRVVRWRAAYDLEFIIPQLVRPFDTQLHPEFLQRVEARRREAMNRLFYHFARDGDPRIDGNLLARFYERVGRYWVTVLNEMALVLFAALNLGAAAYRLAMGGDAWAPVGWLVVAAALAAVNRWLMRRFEESVRRATEEEVEAIVEGHRDDLEKRVADLHSRLGLTYQPIA